MGLAIALLLAIRLLLGSMLGGEAFKRRLVVLGAGNRADRIREIEQRKGSGFLVVGYIAMNDGARLEEHTSELQSLMRISYAVFCLKKKKKKYTNKKQQI